MILLILPCLVFYVVFKYGPMFGIMIAFKEYNIFKGVFASPWVGLKYFRLFIANPDSLQIIRNTFLLGLYHLLFAFPVPVLFALLINELRHVFFKRFVQTVSYIPHFISNVVVAGMITMALSPRGGLVNQLLVWLGGDPVNFLNEPGMFRTIYISSEIWQHAGWASIIYLAALTGVDQHQYEAAMIDGANRFQQTLYVTIPGMLPVLTIMLLLNLGLILEVGFEKVFLLYNPVTYETADIISTYVYRLGLVQGSYSYAAAIDLCTGVVSFVFIYGCNWLSRKYSGNSLW